MARTLEPASDRGFSLLETMLALALASTFITAFFALYSTSLRTFLMASNARRGVAEATTTVNRIMRDVEQAKDIAISDDTLTITPFTGDRVAYRMESRNDTGLHGEQSLPAKYAYLNHMDVVIIREVGDAGNPLSTETLGPLNLIANPNPEKIPLYDYDNTTTTDAVPVFKPQDVSAGGGSRRAGVKIELILKANRDSPPVYVRGLGTIRSLRY